MAMRRLLACFFLVTYRQDYDGIGIGIDAIARHVATVAKINWPFPERILHVFDRPPNFWTMPKHRDPLSDGVYCARRGAGILIRQKSIKALHLSLIHI